MSTNNIGFYEDLTKLSLNYHQLSSNTHVISSLNNPENITLSVNRVEQTIADLFAINM